MSKNNSVAFRRIKGRIVPIKLNSGQKDMAKGAGIAAAGAAVSIAGGRIFTKLTNKAIDSALKGIAIREQIPKMTFKTSRQLTFDDLIARNSLARADKAKAIAKRFAKAAQVVRKASPYVGAGLIGFGAVKFLEGLNKGKKKKMNPDVANALGVAASTAAAYASQNSEKLFTISAISGKQEAFKFMGQGAGSKVKDLLKTLARKKLKL